MGALNDAMQDTVDPNLWCNGVLDWAAITIATEIVGYFDPTPVSDVWNAGLNAADGNYVDAALSLAGAVIPGD